MSTLHTSEQTNDGVLPQPRPLESVSADTPGSRHETGHGRGRKTAAGVQHGRGESSSSTSVTDSHPEQSTQVGGSGESASDGAPNQVFVLDKHGHPLMPCHPGRARQLLAAGRARVVSQLPHMVIRLTDRTIEDSEVDGVEIGIDPGSKSTGLAVFRPSTVDGVVHREGLVLVELQHRGHQISMNLQSRAALRRGRRSRNLRYRQPRFNNRTRPKGWLPPSLQHRVDNVDAIVAKLMRVAPVTAIHVERVRFDTQLMENPDISGVEYQQGALAGYEVREYVLEKWGRNCIYCGVTDTPLNLDHLHPKARRGSNRASNLGPACIPCNKDKSDTPLEVYLAHDPVRLARIQAQMKRPLADAAAVNATRWAITARLEHHGVPVHASSGGRTKFNRARNDVPKSHALDALCVGEVDVIGRWPAITVAVVSTGRGGYQRVITDKYGFPHPKKTNNHKPRTKTTFGFVTGDHARAVIPTGKHRGVHIGRLSTRTRGTFAMTTPAGKIDVHHKYCTRIKHNDGYRYAHQPTIATTTHQTSSPSPRTTRPPTPNHWWKQGRSFAADIISALIMDGPANG